MKTLSVVLVCLVVSVPLSAQRPSAVSTLTVTDTSADALHVGCAVGSSVCVGGIKAGPIDVSAIVTAGAITIASNVPGATTNKLYNNGGNLYFNGVALATGSSLSGTSGKLPKFTGASTLGDSIASEAATTITVAGTLAATTLTGAFNANQLTGTITSATQDLITRLGTITSGVWSGTIIGLAKGGTNADLSATGGTSQFLRQNGVGSAVTVVRPAVADLSDASNVAVLNALNTFTAFGTHAFTSGGASDQEVAIRNTTSGTAARARVVLGNNATSALADILVYSSAYTTAGPEVASGMTVRSLGVGGLSIVSNDASGAIRLYTGGTNLRWGISSAGHWTGVSSRVVDAISTPTIASGFGTSPSIAGTAYAFIVTTGNPSNNGVVNFNTTFSSAPVCTGTSEVSAVIVGILTSTTQATISLTSGGLANSKVYVICRGY